MKFARFQTVSSLVALVVAGAAFAPQAAFAQAAPQAADNGDMGTEIVVTAQRREERSRDVPISITTLSQDQLATANVNSLSDTAKLTPGLRFDSQGPAVQPTIRGVGTAVTTSGGGPNVGIYVDGFFQPNTYLSDFQLMRVQNIQVLKGPQGTLFGRNTTGGAILVTSADPSTTTSGEFKASYGRFDSYTLQAYATTGLAENVAFDVEGMLRGGKGYFTDVSPAGRRNIGRFQDFSIRTGLKVNLTDDVSVLLRYTHAETDDPTSQLVNAYVDQTGEAGFFKLLSAQGQATYGHSSSAGLPLVQMFGVPGAYGALPGSYATAPGQIDLDARTSFRTVSNSVQGTIKADLGFANLTSYTQWRKDHSPYYGDLDATNLPLFGILVDVQDQTFSQEFLLNSKPGGPLQWTAGVNYFQTRDTWTIGASFGTPFAPYGGSSTNTKSIAAFLDATYQVNDRLFLTVGGRYSHDIVTDAYFRTAFGSAFYENADGSLTYLITGVDTNGNPIYAVPPETTFPVPNLKNDSFTPRVVLRYKPSDQSSIYASYTKGYKAGILNVGGLSMKPVLPEKINAYEVGYKYDDRVISLSLAGFYYDYKNLQVSSYQSGAAQIRNAASSEIYGAEAQVGWRVTNALRFNAGGAWTHARYKSFTNAPFYSYCDPGPHADVNLTCGAYGVGSLTQTFIDASGYKMQRSPEFTGNIGASYDANVAEGKLTLSGNLYYTSSFYFDPEQQFKQDGYALLSLRAQWTDPTEHYTLAVYGDNVTNKRYQSQVLFNTLGIGSVWASPATYGVQIGVKF